MGWDHEDEKEPEIQIASAPLPSDTDFASDANEATASDVTNEQRAPEVENDTPSKRAMRSRGVPVAASVLAVLIAVFAIGGVGFTFGHYVFKPTNPNVNSPSFSRTSLPSDGFNIPYLNPTPNTQAPSSPPSASSGGAAAAKTAKAVDTGLVDINTGIAYQGATAAGTGMVLTSNGLVLTNNHVIEGATSISVRDIATNTTYKATVVGYDVSKDIAVLQLKNASGLKTVKLGNSSSVKVNESVVGIGNAGGAGGTPSYAAGTVLATNQSITANSNLNPAGAEQLSGLIETNAPIQEGDSGGPLVTTSGKVIGMDTAASANGGFEFGQTSSNSSQAYAIPINTALAVATAIENGNATPAIHIGATGILGIEVSGSQSLNPGTPTTTNGVTVEGIIPNTPAASSGITAGDIITSFNGQAVTSAESLSAQELPLKPGDSATIDYLNQSGAQQSVTLKLVEGPAQ